MRKMSSRRGFTLAEVLVTVTIIAVLAAVMVPAVLNQVGKGDVPSVTEDLGAIRTAITTFAADTRHFPSTLTQLTGVRLAAGNDFTGVPFGLDTANYRGPYLPTIAGAHTGPTGGVYADKLDSMTGGANHYVCVTDDSVTAAAHSRVPLSVAKQIDLALDGVAGPTAGVVRYTVVGAADTIEARTLRACLTTR